MAQTHETVEIVDVTDTAELRKLAEEVAVSGRARLLRVGGRDVARLEPLPEPGADPRSTQDPAAGPERFGTKKPGDPITDEDRAATLSSFGSWAGLVDADEFEANWRAARGSDRPPVDLGP